MYFFYSQIKKEIAAHPSKEKPKSHDDVAHARQQKEPDLLQTK
jgi:hypothetical protein